MLKLDFESPHIDGQNFLPICKTSIIIVYIVIPCSSLNSKAFTWNFLSTSTSRKWPFCNWSLRLIFSCKQYL